MPTSRKHRSNGSVVYVPKGRNKVTTENISTLNDELTNNPKSALNRLGKYAQQMDISDANFTVNGNSVKSQYATIEQGTQKIDFAFHTDYEPTQVTKPSKVIKTQITATVWDKGNVQSYHILSETKTKSLKNAKTQYEDVLNEWKKATGQKQIKFTKR